VRFRARFPKLIGLHSKPLAGYVKHLTRTKLFLRQRLRHIALPPKSFTFSVRYLTDHSPVFPYPDCTTINGGPDQGGAAGKAERTMSNETRRQAVIVGAFLFLALAAVSPFFLRPNTAQAPALQADRLPVSGIAGIHSMTACMKHTGADRENATEPACTVTRAQP
jgi:hypothetical protein